MWRKLLGFAIALAFLTAGVALGQNADQNTGGPTRNTLGMKVVEPAPGAQITGDTVRVTVGYNKDIFASGQGTRFGEPNFPQPRFDVYLDDEIKTTLKGTESNVAVIPGVAPGSHKITVVALNVSGEVIDRKEIQIRTFPAPPPAAMEKAPEPVKAEPVKAEPVAAPPPVPQPVPAPEAETIPKTASPYPALALAGAALLTAGLLLGRKTL